MSAEHVAVSEDGLPGGNVATTSTVAVSEDGLPGGNVATTSTVTGLSRLQRRILARALEGRRRRARREAEGCHCYPARCDHNPLTVAPKNGCQSDATIKELLADLYGFPVPHYFYDAFGVDRLHNALVFDPEQIGRGRYNAARQALWRAIGRLETRGLLVTNEGGIKFPGGDKFYTRDRSIRLTDAGLQAAAQ